MSRNLRGVQLYNAGTFTRDTPKPQAVQYNGNTYFAIVETNGDIAVFKYQNGTTIAPLAYKVGFRSDYPLADIPHQTPSVCIDNSGYIYIFYGCHDTQLFYRKSINPEDVTQWSTLLSVTGATAATYADPFVLPNGTICILYRNLNSSNVNALKIISTTDGGATWINNTTILAEANFSFYIQGHYLGNETPTPSIHVLVNPRNFPSGVHTTFTSPYHLKSLDGGVTWSNSSGTTFTLPGARANITNVRADALESWSGDLKVNSAGQPYVVYILSGSKRVHFARWNGSSWVDTDATGSPTYIYEHAELDIVSDSTIDIYTPVGTVTDEPGGNMVRYRSTDTGASFSLAETLTTDATINALGPRYFYPRIVRNYLSDIKMIYSYGTTDATLSNSYCTYKTYPTVIKANQEAADRLIPRDFGTSLKFDGATTYALLGSGSNLNIIGGSPVHTITFMVKMNTYSNTAANRLFNESNTSTGNTQYSIYPSDQGNPNNLRMWVRNEANVAQLVADTAAEVFVPNKWVLVGIVNNNGVVSVYSSANIGYPSWEKSGGNLNYTPTGTYTVNRTALGARVYTANAAFLNGLMDDFRFWSGLAMTNQQFKDLFYLGKNPSTPTAWYKADEGSGTSLTDASGNGNTGALTNVVYSSDVAMKLRVSTAGRVNSSGRVAIT